MSKYTMTIQEYIQGVALSDAGRVNVPPYMFPVIIEEMSEEDIHEIGRTLFPSNFPIYNESERTNFMDAFIDHFYFYEIGQETIARFKWVLKDFLNTRMPYYTQLYQSQLTSLEEAMKNYDLEKEETNEGTAETNTTGKTTGTNASSTTITADENATTKNLQFPLNSATIQEISRAENNRNTSDETSTNEDTEVNSEGSSGTTTNNHITGRTHGMLGVNRVERTRAFRDLIISINEMIFRDAKANHLFMEIW